MKIALCSCESTKKARGIFSRYYKDGIIKSNLGWAHNFEIYLNKHKLKYETIMIDSDNWIEKLKGYDVIIWKPNFMGVRSSQIFKEKIYFIQHIMKKRVYPNYQNVWHFDSKAAQSYLFKYNNIKIPDTFVSEDYNDAVEKAEKQNYPVIVKTSGGAGSTGVKMIKNYKEMIKYLNRIFIWERIFNRKVSSKLFDKFGQAVIQEFLPNNDADLRINVYGNKYATGFWRKNRDNDFMASGSGKIDYNTEIPKEIIKYCQKISADNGFDSMAYDILFKDGDFKIIEMSYGYNDKAVYNCDGYYVLDDKGDIIDFVKEHTWPQELWVKWVICSQGIELKQNKDESRVIDE